MCKWLASMGRLPGNPLGDFIKCKPPNLAEETDNAVISESSLVFLPLVGVFVGSLADSLAVVAGAVFSTVIVSFSLF
jgi:hypothetical protein